jgi:hypothetical protein
MLFRYSWSAGVSFRVFGVKFVFRVDSNFRVRNSVSGGSYLLLGCV